MAPFLGYMLHGDGIDIVMKVLGRGSGGFLAKQLHDGLDIIVLSNRLPLGAITTYNMQVQCQAPLTLSVGPNSWRTSSSFQPTTLEPRILELCAGFGGMGVGAAYFGARASASMDNNPTSIAHLRKNSGTPVLQLDITDPKASERIHRFTQGFAHTAAFGFPCQPFAAQGQCRGMASSAAFHAGLRIIYYTQCQAAICECVPNAALTSSACSCNELGGLQYQSRVGRQMAEQTKPLVGSAWLTEGITPWPKNTDYDIIQDILQDWGHLPAEDERLLVRSDFELSTYSNPEYGRDRQGLGLQHKADAFLHSYSNALSGCPRACR